MIEQRVTLRYGAQQIPAIVQAVQGDTGRDVIFELADYEIPAGATANYYIDKPDDTAIYNSAEVISSTEILAHLTEQALAAPGRNNGQVRILSDGEVITSFDFVLEVEVFRGLMRMQSETEVNVFDDALQAAAEEAIQEILDQTPVVTGMQNSIAPSYSASSTYAVGDYVMYNAQLYRCITAITTAEAWTAEHWTQVPLADDVNDLKSALNVTDDVVFSYTERTATATVDGWRLNESDGFCSTNSGYKLVKFTVTAGDIIKIVSDDRFQFQTVASVPSSGTSNRVGKTYGIGEYVLKVPETATYLIVSTPTISNASVYSTVSVKENVNDLQSALDSMSEGLLPLIFKPGTWIDNNTGEEKTDANWTSTDFTEIPENGLYSYMPTGYNGYNFFYDSAKTPISRFYINQTRFTENEIPDGAVYFRCSNTTAGMGTLQIKNNSRILDDNLNDRITSIENASLHNLKGFFMRGTTDANGEIVRISRNMVTDILCSPFDTTFYVKPNSPINICLALFNPLGGAFVSEHIVTSGNSYSVEAGTPFRIVLRNNDGTTVNFSSVADYLICNYVPYETTAKLYFFGQTPVSYPHENDTASGYFNLIETSTGKIIVNDASHQSNNAFIADFINNGRSHFDYFILSHWHDDHCGLIGEFVRLGRIDSSTIVFLPENLHENFLDVFAQEQGTWNFYSDYIVRLQNSGATLVYPTENSKYYIDGLVLEFWNTDHDKYYELEAVDKNYNDLSLCFYLIDGNIRVCYPGDLGPIGQVQCADTMKRCNIHEGQHHGWDNGINNLKVGYIDKLSPEVVVANDGAVHSTYYEQSGSPMVTWCIDNCVPFYRCFTQNDGYVEFKISPYSWQIENIVQRYRRTNL